MKGKPQEFMKIGLIHFMAFPEVMKGEGPVAETLSQICSDPYFQAVEVTHVADAGVRKEAIKVAKDAGFAVAYGCQPVLLSQKLNLNHSEEAERARAVEAAKENIDEAYQWDAAGFAVLSGVDPGDEARDEGWKLLEDSIRQLCEYSAARGHMPVVLETFDRQPYGKNCLAGPTAESVAFAQRIVPDHPSFGLMLDLSHLPLLAETPDFALSAAKTVLRHLHIGNCVMRHPDHPAYGDSHPIFGIEEGENDADALAEFLREALKIDYTSKENKRIVSFELKPYGDQTSADVIQNGKETLDKAWPKV